jgi:protoheme IX farnesyltransferase
MHKPVATLRAYLALTKPGIVRGNVIAAVAGFLIGTPWPPDWGTLAALVVGLSLVIAAACVFNNIIDRDIDTRMARTQQRALVTGVISVRAATGYAVALLAAGSLVLGLWTNALALALALLGVVLYVLVYAYAKRKTPYGTEIGSISGAVPPVVGYAAATGHIDLAAGLLFLILVVWQMPHFFAIAIYRLDEYKAAHIPVLPAVRGVRATRRRILWYTAALIPVALSLSVAGITGTAYTVVAGLLTAGWLAYGLLTPTRDSARWARGMFRFSLVVLLGLCLMLALNHLLA